MYACTCILSVFELGHILQTNSWFTYPICCLGCIKIVNLQGRLKSSRKLSSELTFDFQIESIGKLDLIINIEYLDGLESWTITNHIKFNKSK